MSSKNTSQFLSNENLSVLFEVIVDEYKNYILDKNAFNIAFNEMVQMFYYNQIKSGTQTIHDIVNMNKKFISFISLRLEQKFKIQKQQKKYDNNNINNNNSNNTNIQGFNKNTNINTNTDIQLNNVEIQHVTSEDIKNERLEKFDKELSLKQNEFKNAFNSNVPEMPNFTSPLDKPISEIDVLTKQKLEERENEIQSIYNNNNNNNSVKGVIKNDKKEYDFEIKESNDWLQYFSSPIEKKETNISTIMKSIKIKEEIPKQNVVKEEIMLQQQNRGIEYNGIPKKNISWSDEKGLREDRNFIKIKILDDSPEQSQTNENKSNIFSKLKKIEGGDQNEIDVLTPLPAKVLASISPSELDKVDSEKIIRLENKIDKLATEINKCYDVITLLFNTIMSSSNNATNNATNNAPMNTVNDIVTTIETNNTVVKISES
jgi:hypothetical protein